MSTKLLLILSIAILRLAAQQLNIDASQTTATQAILTYTAPSASACTVQISESQSLSPLVHDVDPSLFPGANLDSRPGNPANGLRRSFVVGNRRSDLASDNKLYSRALQANTQHWYQVSCGTATGSGSFSTANPPLGNNYPDVPPFNAAGFGNYGWPTIDWNDQSKVYIDPLTGIAVKRFTWPGGYGYSAGPGNTGLPFGAQVGGKLANYLDINGAWTNAGNITSGVPTTLATYSGANSDPIFVAYDNTTTPMGSSLQTYNPGLYLVDNVQLILYGSGNTAGHTDVQVCLAFYDSGASGSTSCQTSWQTITLPNSGTGPTTYPASTVFPNGGFWAGWGITPKRNDWTVYTAIVSVSGNTVTTSSNGPVFLSTWKPGTKYYITGSAPACTNNLCTVASVQSNQRMTIVESPTGINNVLGYSAAAGFLIRKADATGSISISAISKLTISADSMLPGSGAQYLCNSNSVTVSYAADGVTPITPVSGELCLINGGSATQNSVLYLLIPSTGETRIINPLWVDTSSQTSPDYVAGPLFQHKWGAFDAADPNSFYAAAGTALVHSDNTVTGGPMVVVKAQYQAGPQCRYQAYTAGANHLSLYPATGDPGQLNGNYGTRAQSLDSLDGSSSCIKYTNITPPSSGHDIYSQMAAQPNYKPFFFSAGGGAGIPVILAGKAMVVAQPYSENTAIVDIVDLSTGLITYAGDTFSKLPARWAGVHASNLYASTRYTGIEVSNGIGYGSGNWASGYFSAPVTGVWKSGAWSSDTSIPADTSINIACPTGLPASFVANGATGNNCVQWKGQMACNQSPNPGDSVHTEQAAFPCEYNPNWSELSPLIPGDFITPLQWHQGQLGGATDSLQIVQVTYLDMETNALAGNATAPVYSFVASRHALQQTACTTNGNYAYPNGWIALPMPACGIPGFGGNTPIFLDTNNVTAGWFLGCCSSHSSVGAGIDVQHPNVISGATVIYQQPFTLSASVSLIGSSYIWTSGAGGSFHGYAPPTAVQSYPSNSQLAAVSPIDKNWSLDFNSMNVEYGGGTELQIGLNPNFQRGTLVAGTNGVYLYGTPTGTYNFKVEPVIGWDGPNLFRDVSSPAKGNIVTDATPYTYCVVYVAGECRLGSSVGQAYVSDPFPSAYNSTNLGTCAANFYGANFPCANFVVASAAQLNQKRIDLPDTTGAQWRRLGMGFMGPGRQYEFSTQIPEPTGKWAVFACDWCDGVRTELFMYKLPPLPGSTEQTRPGNDFRLLTVTLGPNAELDQARVRFGYGENGNPANLYCTTRQENCSTTADSSMPFAYESEGPVWQSCSAGCTIQVPALPGRVLYYAIDRKSSSDGTVQLGELRVKANP